MMLSPATHFVLGFDSFVVCLALGPSRFSVASRYLLAAAFGTCDALAMLLGAAHPLHAAWPGLAPFLLAACLTFVFLFPSRARALAFVLPVPLAWDNFVDGANGLAASPADALSTGLISASLALAGLYLSAALVGVRRRWTSSAACWR
jgi:putative Mn2+ efflux pump MntP